MRNAFYAGLLLLAPAPLLAAGLVPECGFGAGQFMCQACHIAELVHSILTLFVQVAGMAAALMFMYAGFLYLTASANKSNLDSAKRIFSEVLIGLVLVLAAWLVVDLTLRVFTGQSVEVWTKFQCVRAVVVGGSFEFPESPIDAVIPEQNPQVTPSTKLAHEEAKQLLERCGYTITSTGGTSQVYASCQTNGCTSLQGLRADTVSASCGAAAACKKYGNGCSGGLVITGGTECFAHGTKSSITHCNGYKVDINNSPEFRRFITDPNNGFFTKGGTRGGFPEWKDKCGNSIIDEGDHFDYEVRTPCPF